MNQNILRTKTCLPLLLLSIIIALLVIVPVRASVLITDCGADLSTPGEYYVIANNITSAGTCLTTGADNIVIDGQGNSIVFAYAFDADAGEWYWDCGDYFGVSINHNNVTLKNTNISGCGHGMAAGVGIFGANDIVTNNTIRLNDLPNYLSGVVFVNAWPSGPNVTVISDNNITLAGEPGMGNGIYLTESAPVNVTGNNIYINVDNSFGLFFSESDSMGGNFISGNLIRGSRLGFTGILISDRPYPEQYASNIFVNNTIISSSEVSSGVAINSEAGSNIFEDNVLMVGPGGTAFYIEESPYNRISGGSITSAGGLDYYVVGLSSRGYVTDGPPLFLDTNFTDARKIFIQAASIIEFRYGDSLSGKPIVGTSISNPIGDPVLTRSLSLWTQNSILWNDTSSLQGMIAVYNVTGGAPNADYEVTNSSAVGSFTRYLSSDADGNLPVFDVLLEGNTGLNVSCVASCIEPPVVDNTPPEAVIGFDSVSKDIVLFNSETGSEVVNDLNGRMTMTAESSRTMMATPTDYNTKGWDLRQYTFTDDAGNSLVLALEHKKEGHEVGIRLVSMQYNEGPVIEAPRNEIKAEYSDAKDGSLKELEQKIEVKDAFTVNAKYAAKKNETTIKTKLEGRKERKETKAGLVMLELLTEKGGLSFR